MRGSITPRWSSRRRARVWDLRVDGPPHPDGRRRQLTFRGFPTRRAAEAKLTSVIAEVEGGIYQSPTKQTLETFLVDWLAATRSRVRPATHDSYARLIRQHINPHLGAIRLVALTPAILNGFYGDLLANGRHDGRGGLAPRTVRYAHTVVRKALEDARRWGHIRTNPADLADPPRSRSPQMKTWTAEQLGRFLERARGERLTALWFVAATTGLRRGELLGLKWADIDFDKSRIAVRRALIVVGGRLTETAPKSAHGRRSVALDSRTLVLLREHHRQQAQERLAWGPAYEDGNLIFARENGAALRPEWVTKRFTALAASCSLPHIRFHDLRHTHATLALAAGVHPKVVSERLGHAGVAITLDVYSHTIPALEKEAAETVASLLFGSAKGAAPPLRK